MNIIGIDPGLTGALAVYYANIQTAATTGLDPNWAVHDCPTVQVKVGKKTRNVADPTLMAALMREVVNACIGTVHVFLEKVHAMPQQGVSSTFTFGTGYGAWQGVIAAMQLPVTFVTPQAWGKVMLKGMAKGDKQAGRLRALQLFPKMSEDLKLKKNDGRGDALCIGEYGRRLLDG